MLPFVDVVIYKPVRSLTSSLQGILRPSSNRSGESSRQKSEDSKRWQRLQGEWPTTANYTFARGGTTNVDEEREVVGLEGIGVKKGIDVVSGKAEAVLH